MSTGKVQAETAEEQERRLQKEGLRTQKLNADCLHHLAQLVDINSECLLLGALAMHFDRVRNDLPEMVKWVEATLLLHSQGMAVHQGMEGLLAAAGLEREARR